MFRAWTDPAILVHWWGPEGFETPDCKMDVRPGGAWRSTMISPEGKSHTVSGVYREISPPRRLVMTWGWENDGKRGHETEVELYLRAGGGRHADAARPAPVRDGRVARTATSTAGRRASTISSACWRRPLRGRALGRNRLLHDGQGTGVVEDRHARSRRRRSARSDRRDRRRRLRDRRRRSTGR